MLSGAHWVIAVPVAGSQPPPTPTRSPPSPPALSTRSLHPLSPHHSTHICIYSVDTRLSPPKVVGARNTAAPEEEMEEIHEGSVEEEERDDLQTPEDHVYPMQKEEMPVIEVDEQDEQVVDEETTSNAIAPTVAHAEGAAASRHSPSAGGSLSEVRPCREQRDLSKEAMPGNKGLLMGRGDFKAAQRGALGAKDRRWLLSGCGGCTLWSFSLDRG